MLARVLHTVGIGALVLLCPFLVAARGEESAPAAATPVGPTTVRYSFSKDRPLIYRTEVATSQTQSLAGMKVETTMKNTDVSVRTLEKTNDDGNFVLKTENKRLLVSMKSAIGEYKFDSASTEREKGSMLSESLNPLYERLSGAALTIIVTPRGEVKEVEGYEQLLADALKENPIAAQFAAGGGKKAAALGYQEAFDQFKAEPVQSGDRWEMPFELELPKLGKATGKRTYVFDGGDKRGDRPTLRFSVGLELSFDVDIEQGGAKVTGKLSSNDSSGTVHFDPKLGATVFKKSKYSFGGDLNVAAGGNNIAVRSDQTQSVTVELLDKLPE